MTFALMLAAAVAGCKAAPVEPDLHATGPEPRIAGIIAAAESDNPQDLPLLIEALDDEDAAVRLFAAETLYRRTGRQFGYHAYDPPAARREAIAHWKRYLSGRLAEAGPIDENP